MPPPPPPSKSYLLVLESDSSDDDSEHEYRRRQEYYRAYENLNSITPSKVLNSMEDDNEKVNNASTESLLVDEDHTSSMAESDESHQDTGNKKLTKNQKKRLQRKKKKKAAHRENNEENLKGVSFSGVSVRAFPRAFSMDSVPAHGGWPLGMKLDGYEDLDEIPVGEYEMSKQKRLHERWMAILSARDKKTPGSPSKSSASSSRKKKDEGLVFDDKVVRMVGGNAVTSDCCGEGNGCCALPEINIYESRQWDYKSRIKNPLFRTVSEDERHAIFLEGSDVNSTSNIEAQKRNSNNTQRARSNSIGNHKHNCGKSRRSRSNSIGNHDLDNSMKGKFNEEYNQAMVHHVRNELEQVRIGRSKSGATGCNCRKLVVYLPPSDGSGGKKAQHRRLKPSKVVQELKKRGLYDSVAASSSREQIEKMLHDAVEKEPCCGSEDCFCVRNGLICQGDSCSCWHDSHVHAKHSSGSSEHTLSNADIRKRCGNPLGTYLVDTEAIDNYRIKVMAETNQQQG